MVPLQYNTLTTSIAVGIIYVPQASWTLQCVGVMHIKTFEISDNGETKSGTNSNPGILIVRENITGLQRPSISDISTFLEMNHSEGPGGRLITTSHTLKARSPSIARSRLEETCEYRLLRDFFGIFRAFMERGIYSLMTMAALGRTVKTALDERKAKSPVRREKEPAIIKHSSA